MSKGKLQAFFRDFKTKEIVVQLSIVGDNTTMENLEPLLEQEVEVDIKKWRERRSLNANSYFHVLVHKIAEVLRISDTRCKNMMITAYGQPDFIGESKAIIKSNIPPEKMWEQEMLHCRPIQGPDDAEWYVVYRGSHTYNTEEMSRLIDMTVEQAKELGIETLPPDELERLKKLWNGKA